jgi:hypothetical protein
MKNNIAIQIGQVPIQQTQTVTFTVEGEAILVIDKEGILYMGERVKDAGEAYTAVMDAMNRVSQI